MMKSKTGLRPNKTTISWIDRPHHEVIRKMLTIKNQRTPLEEIHSIYLIDISWQNLIWNKINEGDQFITSSIMTAHKLQFPSHHFFYAFHLTTRSLPRRFQSQSWELWLGSMYDRAVYQRAIGVSYSITLTGHFNADLFVNTI